MQKLLLALEGQETDIVIGNDQLSKMVSDFLAMYDASLNKIFLVTDANVSELYAKKFVDLIAGHGFAVSLHVFAAGEANKAMETVTSLAKDMLEIGVDRNSVVVGLGGGVVTDVASLLASLLCRGLGLILFPTSLLAQVDASIGGKTGVDLNKYKNILGTFYPAKAVCIDLAFLKTLPKEEFLAGMTELCKHALINDADLAREIAKYDFLFWQKPENYDRFLEVFQKSLAVKIDLVARDFREENVRKLLNLGHTSGHALEAYSDFNISHGVAVARGIYLEAIVSNLLGKLSDADLVFVRNFVMPLCDSAKNKMVDFDFEQIWLLMLSDKKNSQGKVYCSILESIGSASCSSVDYETLKKAWLLFLKDFYA